MRVLAVIAVLVALASTPVIARAESALKVTSPAFAAGAAIPSRYSLSGENRAPPLNWTSAPGAQAYAIVVSDPDAPGPRPFVHWIAWNIPGSVHALPEGGLPGMVQGRNGHGLSTYSGPHPPSGTHHYHFQVFALDAPLKLGAEAEFASLAVAMKGHVLAQGELVGTFAH